MNLQTATEKVADFMQSNLFDPISNRASCWIYSDKGRVNLDKTNYPKVLFENDTPTNQIVSHIGSSKTLNEDIIVMRIKAKFGHHYGLGTKKYTGKEFVGKIGQDAEDLIKDQQNDIRSKGFLDVIPVGQSISYDQEANPTFELRIRLRYIT